MIHVMLTFLQCVFWQIMIHDIRLELVPKLQSDSLSELSEIALLYIAGIISKIS